MSVPLTATRLARAWTGITVFADIDFAIGSGEIVALLGANGSGKSTLLRTLAGVLRPSAGEVRWFGDSPHKGARRRRLVGFAGHETGLYSELTVFDNLIFSARMHGIPHPRESVLRLVSAAGVEPCVDQRVARLSQGLKQRVSLVRALIHDPAIVLLDEPFASLDEHSRKWLEAWLRELRAQGKAICISTHDPGHCLRLADRAMQLVNQRLVDARTSNAGYFPVYHHAS